MKRPTVKIQYDAPVALTFALLSLASLMVNHFTDGWANMTLFSVYRSSFADGLTYVRMFLHILGHASPQHFFSNISLFLVLAPIVESKYGSSRLFASIAVTAFVSGLFHFVLYPGVALLGASGIVFMMIFLASMANSRGGTIPVSLILVSLIYIGNELVDLITVEDKISQLSHILGGACGIICGKISKR